MLEPRCKYCQDLELDDYVKSLYSLKFEAYSGELFKAFGYPNVYIFSDTKKFFLNAYTTKVHRAFKIKYCPKCGRKLVAEDRK